MIEFQREVHKTHLEFNKDLQCYTQYSYNLDNNFIKIQIENIVDVLHLKNLKKKKNNLKFRAIEICHKDLKSNNILCLQGRYHLEKSQFQIENKQKLLILILVNLVIHINYLKIQEIQKKYRCGHILILLLFQHQKYSQEKVISNKYFNYILKVKWLICGVQVVYFIQHFLPFNAEYLNDLVENIKLAKYDFPEEIFQKSLLKPKIQYNSYQQRIHKKGHIQMMLQDILGLEEMQSERHQDI